MLNKHNLYRLQTMMVLCIMLFVVLLGRLVYLQLWRGDYYSKQSDGNRLRQSRIIAPRGLILDKDGKELVNNLPGYAVSLQKQTEYDQEMLQRLSVLIDMPLDKIQERIKESRNYYEPVRLRNNLPPDIVTKIEEQRRNLPDVLLEIQPIRTYPYKELAVHALGYVGEVSSYEIENKLFNVPQGSIVGKAGIEKSYDKYLRGTDGAFMEEVDVAGNVVQHFESLKPVPGKNLKLTLDLRLQSSLEKFTDQHLSDLRRYGIAPEARAAAVIALDPRSGAVRAMVSRPAYDPNLFVNGISSKDWEKINNDRNYPMNNKVISGEYPPGSTFKIVTGSAAFELNKVKVDELIYDGGHHPLVPTMGNAGGEVLGWLDFIKGLAMSDNVYFYELGYRVGIDNIAKYAGIYGFGKPTGIDLEGESSGLVASKQVKRDIWNEDWRLGDTFNAAIGQGFNLATPIQLAMMLSIVANGGTQYQPYLVDAILNADGTEYAKAEHGKPKRIDISQQTIDYMRMGMSATTQEGGTASYFNALPRKIAGKTGTAENSHGRDHGLFVAYGPVEDPELVVVCIVEQGGYGSSAAGPIVYKVFEEYFRERGWMPEEEPETAPTAAPAQAPASEAKAVAQPASAAVEKKNAAPTKKSQSSSKKKEPAVVEERSSKGSKND